MVVAQIMTDAMHCCNNFVFMECQSEMHTMEMLESNGEQTQNKKTSFKLVYLTHCWVINSFMYRVEPAGQKSEQKFPCHVRV